LLFTVPLLSLALVLTAVHGPPHGEDAAFHVGVSGRAGQEVRLRADGIPPGYIASFCTPRVCAPFRVTLALPASGRATIELHVIQTIPRSAPPRIVTVTAAGARPVSLMYPQPNGARRGAAPGARRRR